MNTNDILSFFGKAEALLGALVAAGIVKSSSGTEIASILGDVSNVVKGAQNPTPELASNVAALFNDLQVDGVLTNKLVGGLDNALSQFATFGKAIQSGQVGIGPRETLLGVPGSWVYIPDAAPADVKAPLGL